MRKLLSIVVISAVSALPCLAQKNIPASSSAIAPLPAAPVSSPAVQKLLDTAIKNRLAFNYEVAIEVCNQALKIDPKSRPVLQEKAGNEYRAEWFGECVKTTTYLLKLQANNVAAREMRANSYYALKQYGAALADLKIVQKTSKDPAVAQLAKTCERLIKTGSADVAPPEGQ